MSLSKKKKNNRGINAHAPVVKWNVERPSRAVHRVNIEFNSMTCEQWVLLRSDAHHDNTHCDQELEKVHLDEAKERGALIFDGGDLFCAMQGKWDRRKDLTQLRPEYQGADYLDRLVNEATDFYAPYADNFIVMSPGNHEHSILEHHESNLTERLVERLNQHTTNKHKISRGGYSSWVQFNIKRGARPAGSINMFCHHGYGGGGPVTRGVIQTNRMAVYLPDADVIWTGHTHDEWVMPIQRARITGQGVLYQDQQVHVKTSGYKDEYADGYDGWHIRMGRPPKPVGAVWMRIFMECDNERNATTPSFEFMKAK